jgi:hypothetical protein
MFCPYCGNKLPDDAEFCSECGKKISIQNNQGTYTQHGEAKNGKPQPARKAKYTFLCILVVAAVAIGLVIFFKYRKPSEAISSHVSKNTTESVASKDGSDTTTDEESDDSSDTADENYDTSQNTIEISEISDFSDGYAWVNYKKDGEERRGICDKCGRITVSFAEDKIGYETPVKDGSAYVVMRDKNQYIIDVNGNVLADLSGYDLMLGAKNGYYMFYNAGLIDNYEGEYVFFDSKGKAITVGNDGQPLEKKNIPKELAAVSPGEFFPLSKIWDESQGKFIFEDNYHEYFYPGAQNLLNNEYAQADAMGDSFDILSADYRDNQFFCYEKTDADIWKTAVMSH